jgi:hypothetical protein
MQCSHSCFSAVPCPANCAHCAVPCCIVLCRAVPCCNAVLCCAVPTCPQPDSEDDDEAYAQVAPGGAGSSDDEGVASEPDEVELVQQLLSTEQVGRVVVVCPCGALSHECCRAGAAAAVNRAGGLLCWIGLTYVTQGGC